MTDAYLSQEAYVEFKQERKKNPTSGAYCQLKAVSGFVHPIYSRNLRVA